MPAKNLLRVSEKDTYLHIYNRGVEGRNIFVDKDDYEVFLSFLREYLINPTQIETQKKTFTVKGKTYSGTPHLPKNYYKKVELLAYALTADHFHLVLHQRSKDMIQGFIRSLCTRYSIYFNKKYDRRGSLFEGPYKSAHVENTTTLVDLINYIHNNHSTSDFTSEAVYKKGKTVEWMSKFDFTKIADNNNIHAEIELSNGAENQRLREADQNSLSKVIIEKKNQPLERRILDKDLTSKPVESIQKEQKIERQKEKTNRRIPEYIALTATFVVFLGFGLRNISNAASLVTTNDSNVSKADVIESKKSDEKIVLSASDSATPTDPLSLIYSYVVVTKGSSTVIYKSKDTTSGAITTAHEGDHFVAYPIDPDWYQIRFTDNSEGYILSKYIDIEQSNSK